MRIVGPQFKRMKLVCMILLNVFISDTIADGSGTSLEYHVKAGFLGNFARFIRWPATAFPKSNTPYIIGILGDDPFGPVIDQAIEGFTVEARSLIVKRYNNTTSLEFCHILFISRSQKTNLDNILAQLQKVPTLTVSDINGFCKKGGMINFIHFENNIRFEINASASQKARLKLSSNLLALAKAIY